jgi:putative MATE family efflux protein
MKKIDLASDSVIIIFVRYAVPSVLGMLAMSTAQVVDGIFIGRFVGPQGLAAVNLAWPLLVGFTGLSLMIGTGGATLANIHRGGGDRKKGNELYTLTMALLALVGVAGSLIGFALLRFIPLVLGADDSVKQLVMDYLGIIFIFAPFFLLVFTQDMFIRGDGKPVFPVAVMMSGSVVNIVLDYLFVAVFRLGIQGAAWATGISQILPFLLMGWYLIFRTGWSLVKPRFELPVIFRIMYNGLSEFVDEVSIGLSLYIFNWVLMLRIGSLGVAAYSIAGYVGEIVGIIFYSIAQAIHPAVSFNRGAGNIRRTRAFRNAAFLTNGVIGLGACLALLFSRDYIAGLFVTDGEVIRLASEITLFFSFSLILMGINMAAAMYFTALDRPAESAVIALSRSFVMLMAGLFLLPLILGTRGLWLSFLFAEAVTLIFTFLFIKKSERREALGLPAGRR